MGRQCALLPRQLLRSRYGRSCQRLSKRLVEDCVCQNGGSWPQCFGWRLVTSRHEDLCEARRSATHAHADSDPDMITAEYEFYQFRAPVDSKVPASDRNSSNTARFLQENPVNALPSLTEGMFGYSLTRPVHNQDYYYGIYDACEKFNCGIEGWHTESGPGVFEAVRWP